MRHAGLRARAAERELLALYSQISARILNENTLLVGDARNQLINDVNSIYERGIDTLINNIESGAIELSQEEADFYVKALTRKSDIVFASANTTQIVNALLSSDMDTPVGTGKLSLKEALIQFSDAQKSAIQNIIVDGILAGQSGQDIAVAIQTQAKLRPRHQVNALVRTVINHASSQAHKVVAQENRGVLQFERWTSVLDNRTTLICAGRDGITYQIGKGPYPPAHWNCRSIRMAIPIGQDAKEIKDFDSWLRGQSNSFKKEYFSQFPDGDAKLKLFDDGLEIARFRDELGNDFTLDQLREMEPVAFEDAGI